MCQIDASYTQHGFCPNRYAAVHSTAAYRDGAFEQPVLHPDAFSEELQNTEPSCQDLAGGFAKSWFASWPVLLYLHPHLTSLEPLPTKARHRAQRRVQFDAKAVWPLELVRSVRARMHDQLVLAPIVDAAMPSSLYCGC